MPLKTFTLRERPELEEDFDRFADLGWPRFLRQRDELGVGRYWPSLFTTFADFQLAVVDELGPVVAVGHTVPLVWDHTVDTLPESIAEILRRAGDDRSAGRRPTVLSAIAAIVNPAHRGKGISTLILRQMTALAARHGLTALIGPVRPTLKTRYPLTPMDRFVRWTTPDGAPLDPWMRTHWRLGAEILRVAPRTLVITGSVAQWEDWTDMRFPDSGPYVVPGALQPVIIDREGDEGRYEDPNVWMRHTVTPGG
jgi:GNAT superfamily N-acetyltransferase